MFCPSRPSLCTAFGQVESESWKHQTLLKTRLYHSMTERQNLGLTELNVNVFFTSFQRQSRLVLSYSDDVTVNEQVTYTATVLYI